MDDRIIIVFFIVLVILLILLFFVILKMGEQKNKTFLLENNKVMQEQMLSFQSGLLQALHQDMNQFNETALDRLYGIEKNVNAQIVQNLQMTNEAYTKVVKEVSKIDEAQKHLQQLSGNIQELHTIFSDKKSRGLYGEIELYTLLERAFGDSNALFSKQYRLSNGAIADAVIFGNSALGMIAVDSKFPLENYYRLHNQDLSVMERKVATQDFKANIKKHISDIAAKYILEEETCSFAYMFLPSEAVFSYIHAYFPEMVDYSFVKKVYIVSPSSLMAHITAIKALYIDQKKNERIKEIQLELNQLSIEFARFTKRYESVMKDYEKTAADMHDVMVSAKKISKRFTQIDQVDLQDLDEDSFL